METKSNAMFLEYKKCRNKFTHAKELSKRNYYQSLFISIDTSGVWTHINSILRKNRKSSATLPTSLNDQGKVLYDRNKMCNAINHYFANIGNKIAPPVLVKKEDYYCHLKKRQCNSIILNLSDDYEIIEAINGLNCHKSPGYIDVPVKLIKHAKFIIVSYLSRSFNSCIEKGYYPHQLKIAKMVPSYKSGNKTEVGNNRPISILSPINKVFETLLQKRLIAYWEKFNLFTNHQFGFRKKHSTNLAIFDYIETILDLRDKTNIVSSTFIDIRKAFDLVNHKILLGKLEHYGVRGQPLQLLRSYLSNRMQYISVNDKCCSSMIPITCGVPQGSILGQFLFLVYLNDVPTCTDSKMALYADDAVLICHEKSKHTLKAKTEKELKNVKSWVTSNKLSLNFDKTHCMLYNTQTKANTNSTILL